jgi:predicted TPR repeat methyltransferase
MSMQSHYETHLGPIYAWMLGNLDAALKRAGAELDEMGLPTQRGTALDLGAGLGLHSVALAKHGFQVTAIDSCRVLLDEFRPRAAGLPINIIEADIATFATRVAQPCDVIICLGDTLTHLPTLGAVTSLLRDAAATLCKGGLFATTFRDYASKTLEGNERFILVKRDENRILTCCLDYGEDRVTVHDVLTQREDEEWVQRVSSYPKLRLAPDWVIAQLKGLGLAARLDTAPSGMVRIVARNASSSDS